MFNKIVYLNGKPVGAGYEPYIIAELSGNHNQSLERALKLVECAAKAGAHAVKLQTYTADTMTLNVSKKEFIVDDIGSLWGGKSLYELYAEAYTPWEWHKPIMEKCNSLGLHFFSTPFDSTALKFLESLNVPFYKIASPEIVDLPLIKLIAKTRKPIIASTGMANLTELHELVETLTNEGCENLILLKCTTAYPAPPEEMNLRTIPHMMELFDLPVGLSDHTLGIGVSVASVALGACVIEKHFTLNREEGGIDSAFSIEPNELAALRTETHRAWESLGRVNYSLTPKESKNRQYRRSIYVSKDMMPGAQFTAENIRVVRPGFGLSPKYYENIVGRRATQVIKKGTPLTWDIVE